MTDHTTPTNPFLGLETIMETWTSALKPSAAGGDPAELAARLFDPRHWFGAGGAALEQPFETLLGLPKLADVPDVDRKMLNLMQAWMGVAQHGGAYGVEVSRIWAAAYADVLRTLQAAAAKGEPLSRETVDKVTAAMNERLLKAQRSDAFLQAQRRLLDAMLKSRAAEGELVEIGAKAADLPTRTEMDDVHKTLHAVKREVRALQRRLAAAEERGAGGEDGASRGKKSGKA